MVLKQGGTVPLWGLPVALWLGVLDASSVAGPGRSRHLQGVRVAGGAFERCSWQKKSRQKILDLPTTAASLAGPFYVKALSLPLSALVGRSWLCVFSIWHPEAAGMINSCDRSAPGKDTKRSLRLEG